MVAGVNPGFQFIPPEAVPPGLQVNIETALMLHHCLFTYDVSAQQMERLHGSR